MRRCVALLVLLASLLASGFVVPSLADEAPGLRAGRPLAPTGGVWIAEVVTDPQTDRDRSGSTTSSDEYVALRNAASTPVDLTGWTLLMHDSTPETASLDGTLGPGATLLLANPTGQLNNDVRLVLRDATGTERDNVTLARSGIPTGNAEGAADEAVHLTGPWAALRGPATGGTGLGPVWLDDPGTPWIAGTNATLTLRAHTAPDHDPGTVTLHIGDTQTIVQTNATAWTPMPFTPPPNATTFHLAAADWTLETTPSGAPFTVRIDPHPPRIGDPDDVVLRTDDGTLRWIPTATDTDSGLATVRLTATNATASWDATGCDPCTLPGDNATLTLEATDHAGQTTRRTFAVHTDGVPPPTAADIVFTSAATPTLSWSYRGEPLQEIRLEIAEDPDGLWPVANHTLDASARSFQDTTWTPGTERAYRLITIDRAGHRNATRWIALPADAAPAQVHADTEGLAERLVRSGQAELTLVFDRPLAEPPTLHTTAGAAHLTSNGTRAPDGRSASYRLVTNATLPGTATLTLRTSGGLGEDGAESAPWNATIRYDLDAPHVRLDGTNASWIRAARHTVRLHAEDTADPAPGLHLQQSPKHAAIQGNGSTLDLSFNREGRHDLIGHATDAAGNNRTFAFRIGMDATPPTIIESGARPSRWSTADPIMLNLTDATSGVNTTSLRVWARNATTTRTEVAVNWTGDQASITPTAPLSGPFELYVAVADNAGNPAEGLLGRRITLAVAAPPDATTPVPSDPDAAPAPDAAGPGWRPVPAAGAPTANAKTTLDLDTVTDAARGAGKADKSGAPGLGIAAAGAGIAATLGTVVHRFGRRRRTED